MPKKADHPSGGKPAKVQHWTGGDEAVYGLISGHQRAEKDDQNDDDASEIFDPAIAIGEGLRRLPPGKHEGDPERCGGTGIGDVVDGVRE